MTDAPEGRALTELLPPARSGRAQVGRVRDAPLLTVDSGIMHGLASRSLKAGHSGLASVGILALNHGDGATTMARSLSACLAASFAKRVVLVEANLRSPSLRRAYQLGDGPGLSDVLAGAASLEDALRAARGSGTLAILPASTAPAGNPAALPGAPLRQTMSALFGYADVLVFDLAPLLPYPDSGLLCGSLDGVVLVLRAGRSRKSEGERALRLLHREGVPVLGAILNRERAFIPRLVERLL
jgi:Mrp family chromosome partitioning ATPase